MKLKTNRIETLADGIVAIVMTIMIVNLIEVFNFTNPLRENDFYKLYYSLKHDFASYIISFLILGVLWLQHHRQFHFIKYTDSTLIFLNIFWFMFICLIPFSTMLMGNHENFITPVVLFELNILISSIILYIHWAYATSQHRLVDLELNKMVITQHRKVGLFLVTIPLAAICLTFINTVLSLAFLFIFYFIIIFYKGLYV
jgi:uncharacterized membrane protein